MTKEVMTTIMRTMVLTEVALVMLTWKVKALIVLLGSPSQPSLQKPIIIPIYFIAIQMNYIALAAYILKAKKFAESAFQSHKNYVTKFNIAKLTLIAFSDYNFAENSNNLRSPDFQDSRF